MCSVAPGRYKSMHAKQACKWGSSTASCFTQFLPLGSCCSLDVGLTTSHKGAFISATETLVSQYSIYVFSCVPVFTFPYLSFWLNRCLRIFNAVKSHHDYGNSSFLLGQAFKYMSPWGPYPVTPPQSFHFL